MKNSKKSFDSVSMFALIVLSALIIFAVFTNALIMLSPVLKDARFPASGTIGMLFDYSANAGHKMKMLGQALSNVVAYVFMLAAVVIFILSLVLIKHNKAVKAKCAVLGLALLIPAVFGFTGGVIDFFAHGFVFLNVHKSLETGIIMGGMVVTLLLDVAYLVLAIICLVNGIGTAVKVNKGEVRAEDLEEARPADKREESQEEKAEREEKEAADRVEMLENIRQIVREELDKLDRIVIAKEVKAVVKEEARPAPAPAPAPAPTPVVAPAPAPVVEEEESKLSIQRIPFAEKIVKADKDLQEKYNELKAELLAYGASSRVSISGDTFRLHRKPYVKITLIGKTLKCYFALDPKEFNDSTIPVVDASDKVAYEEVPTLLKVKSNLSVKRAKELAKLAFAKDGVEMNKEVKEHNFVKDIRAELRAKK